ncbi:MAG: prepilin peptidase [Nanoarchaeota archaeon]|nr:prepilin peptidase [Nanoarchaeota archaeon]
MVLPWLLAAVGIVGFGAAGYKDLTTTEFPDWLPYSVIISALAIRGGYSWFTADWSFLLNSVIVGLAFLGAGLGLYYTKQWGDGDAWLLGALGFLFPDAAGLGISGTIPFPIILLFNFFILAVLYLLTYSLVLGLKNRKLLPKFKKQLCTEAKGIAQIVIVFTVATVVLAVSVATTVAVPPRFYELVIIFPFFLIGILLFVQYGRFIEKYMFHRRIPVAKLREGDVPASGRWRVLNKKEIQKLKKRGGTILVKEGVRFAPVFAVTVLVTVLFGSLLFFG